jgi:uncharacterized protein
VFLEISAILLIIFLAGIVQGSTGFGSGMVAVALLSFIMNIKDATLMLLLSGLMLNGYILLRLRKHFQWERVWPMYVSMVPGTILGVLLLVKAPPHILEAILGVVLLGAVIQQLIPRLASKPWHPLYLGIPCGLFAGGLQGALGTGGPPLVAYTASQRFDRYRYSASIQMVMGSATMLRIIGVASEGTMLNTRTMLLNVGGILFVLAGAWVGLHVFKRLPAKVLRAATLILLFILSIKYLIAGLI